MPVHSPNTFASLATDDSRGDLGPEETKPGHWRTLPIGFHSSPSLVFIPMDCALWMNQQPPDSSKVTEALWGQSLCKIRHGQPPLVWWRTTEVSSPHLCHQQLPPISGPLHSSQPRTASAAYARFRYLRHNVYFPPFPL